MKKQTNMDFRDRQLYSGLKQNKFEKPTLPKNNPNSFGFNSKKVERPAFGEINTHLREKLENVSTNPKKILRTQH